LLTGFSAVVGKTMLIMHFFVRAWLWMQVGSLKGKTLIHLSGPVGTCKSTLARLIARIKGIPVLLVDELKIYQQFFFIYPDGTKTRVNPDTDLPEHFIVVVANCGSSPKALPNKKKGVFPAVAHQKLGPKGKLVALVIKRALLNGGYHNVKMWELLDALVDRFGLDSARETWVRMVFDRPDNSYVRHILENGNLTFPKKLFFLRKDWAKKSMPWAETVLRLTQPRVSVRPIEEGVTLFKQGYLHLGEYIRGDPPQELELNRWYGNQQLPIQEDGTVRIGNGVPHVTLGNKLPFVEKLCFSFRVSLSYGETVVGVAKYAPSGKFWYHMTEKADGISPAMLGADFVKNALDKFEDNAAGGGAKAD